MAVPFLACMMAAAAWYHLPPRVLPSIQKVEGGRPGLISHNTNGSDDYGVMQVNSLWVVKLGEAARLPEPIVRTRLIADPCFNIAAAAAIMRAYLDEAHGNVLIAVAWYHSRTPTLGAVYCDQVLRAAEALFERRCRGGACQ